MIDYAQDQKQRPSIYVEGNMGWPLSWCIFLANYQVPVSACMLNSRRNVEGSLVLATNLRKVQVCRTRITSPWGLSAAGYLSSAAHAADLFRFMIICQWESQSSESLLPLIESAQQGLPQQEWLLRQGKKCMRLFQAHTKSWYFVKGKGQNVFGQFSFNWFNNHVKVTCDDGTSYKTGVEKSYKHPRFQEQSSTFTLSVMSLN